MQTKRNPFPEVDAESESGLALGPLCASVHRLWQRCQENELPYEGGVTPPEWETTDDDFRYGWERGVCSTLPLIEAADGSKERSSWSFLARSLYGNIQAAIADGSGYRGWDQFVAKDRLLWHTCVRLLTDLMQWHVEDGPLEDFVERMRLWYVERLKNLSPSFGLEQPPEQPRLAA